ncbi:MAG: hypothetical protein M1816_002416 [Peltula sp. TS41687]|nr:MAG: hypothetical protein M1816_002416 [Peltula sp. TS41687]
MGGKVFTHPGRVPKKNKNHDEASELAGLHTPRMDPATYFRLRAHLLDVLTAHYTQVVVPREAPEKTSYGDVDVLVESPVAAVARGSVAIEDLAKSMGAMRWVKRGSRSMSFAIPADDDTGAAGEGEEGAAVYRQVDVYVCRTGEMEWARMFKGDGMAWNIIGLMLRPVGITVNDVGLFVRVREIEMEPGWGRDKAMIWLTGDSVEMMEFLGLDRMRWEMGFETVREVFDWIAGMRWFVVFEQGDDDEEKKEEEKKKKKKLKAKDRRRVEQREMYRCWMEDYLPSCSPNTSIEKNGAEKGSEVRERALQEALDRFKKREEYEARLKHWKMAVAVNKLWRRVADSLPDDGERKGLTMRGLKKRINLLPPDPQTEDAGEDDEQNVKSSELRESQQPYIIPELVIPDFRTGEGTIDEEDFFDWVSLNCEQVYHAEKRRVEDEIKKVAKLKQR